jgi:diguanylate cyclase (GGDEF)-like protein
MSLIRRVSWLMVLVVVLALVGGVFTTLIAARDTLQTQLGVKNRDNAQALALALSQQRGDVALMELVLAAQFDTGHYRSIVLTSSDGRAPFRREADALAGVAPAWFVRALPVRAEPGVAQVSDGWRAIGRLELISQSAYATDALWRAGLRAAQLLALVGVAGGVLAAWGLRAIRRPLDAAAQQAHALQEGRFVTVPEPDVAELRPLARTMNAMVDRLSAMFDAQARQVDVLRQQAQTDALTGVANRRQFLLDAQQRFEQAAEPVPALLLFRVQDLEGLNRRAGHAAVDRQLRALTEALGMQVTAQDRPLLGRLNGSDFALLVTRADATTLCTSLLAVLRQALQGGEHAMAVVAGVAVAAEGADLASALAAADQALAQAEAAGPFTMSSRPCAGRTQASGEGDWQRQLIDALQQGRVELAEYAVRDARGGLAHLDCPLRVQLRPDGAFESAASWLALATRSRLTTGLDQQAVSLALAKIAHDDVGRCVNVAAASMLGTEFVAAISAQLQAAPRAAAKLWIDIPESLASSHPGVIQELTRQWRGLGVHLGLEHAGAALAGMTRLYQLGLDYVRIDARFLAGIAHDVHVRRHAEGLVALLRGIGLAVYAEGVNDADDLRVLWALGFDGATGPAVSSG